MKFVAKNSFFNAPQLGLKIDKKDTPHPDHVPKGYKFEIEPSADSLKGVKDNAKKELIAGLVVFGHVVVDDGTPESKDAIAQVNREVEEEAAAAKAKPAILSLQEQISVAVASAVVETLKALGITPKAPEPKAPEKK